MSDLDFFQATPVFRLGGIDDLVSADGQVKFLGIGAYVDGWNGSEKTDNHFTLKLFDNRNTQSSEIERFKKLFGGDENKGRNFMARVVPSQRMVNRTYEQKVSSAELAAWYHQAMQMEQAGQQLTLTIPIQVKVTEFVVRDFRPVDPPRTATKGAPAQTQSIGVKGVGAPAAAGASIPAPAGLPAQQPATVPTLAGPAPLPGAVPGAVPMMAGAVPGMAPTMQTSAAAGVTSTGAPF